MTDPLELALDRVMRHATDLASAWGSRARASTTVARERAILRLFGVTGLDHAGVPLASAVVERAMGEDPARLAGSIALPFAVALLEYDIPPQQLALDVANGAIDLAFESQLLADPDRRAVRFASMRSTASAAMRRTSVSAAARRSGSARSCDSKARSIAPFATSSATCCGGMSYSSNATAKGSAIEPARRAGSSPIARSTTCLL